MALGIKHDSQQWQELIDAINGLSDNLAKWQSETALAIEAGFNNLNKTLSGDEGESQEIIDRVATQVRSAKESLQSSITRNQPKEEGEQ